MERQMRKGEARLEAYPRERRSSGRLRSGGPSERSAHFVRRVARSGPLFVLLLAAAGFVAPATPAHAQPAAYVAAERADGSFPLVADGRAAPLFVSDQDWPGVVRAARDLQADVERVSRVRPGLTVGAAPAGSPVVLIGTIGRSPVIDRLVRDGKLDVSGVAGKWETFLLQPVRDPLPGVPEALVIAGSDKRGTIFGIYDLSQQIGVSPWYFWADVPARHQPELFVAAGRHTLGEPAVQYRGIFINDENPALLGWVNHTFGGFNHRFYETVFELILRMKGNYLWPAMWGKAIYDDDPRTGAIADEYGIVLGTSHHEPLGRAHVEWRRYGNGPWDYSKNAPALRDFWRGSVERMKDFETIVTVGMRGDGDEPMTDETAIALLEGIIRDQRQILRDVTGRDPATIPQIWALYKEVQDYLEQGMKVPDDITLLFADDNWGNIRLLPKLGSNRPGGYGVYYHFDYVGGPRSYKWTNTNQIERTWEQMHLAHRFGATRIWIVNVGDIKPVEFPIEFFLDFAWNPEWWPAERLPEYTHQWATRQFGPEYANEIAHVLTEYSRINSRRKPELVDSLTYSQVNYREADRVVEEYRQIVELAEEVGRKLDPMYRDAYFQLVLYMAKAAHVVQELHTTVGKNHLYARQGRAATNDVSRHAHELFALDAELTRQYHEDIADGKWVDMMSQARIGYSSWADPGRNIMPRVDSIALPAPAEMGVAVEGSASWWPAAAEQATLPQFDPYNRQVHYVDVFNRGRQPFGYRVRSGAPWVRVTPARGRVQDQQRLQVSVDWNRAPRGTRTVPITITGPNRSRVVVHAVVSNPEAPRPEQVAGFVEGNGYVSMEAESFTGVVNANGVTWQRIPDIGRTRSGMTPFPVTMPAQTPGAGSPHLEYRMHLFDPGEVTVQVYLSPTLDIQGAGGLRYAMSFNDEAPRIVNMHADRSHVAENGNRAWEQMVADNVRIDRTTFRLDRAGEHVLRFWAVDPGVVVQKIVVDTGGLKPSYLGPPESFRGGDR
jgi:hypothetical protein